jgi:hypothetical protein
MKPQVLIRGGSLWRLTRLAAGRHARLMGPYARLFVGAKIDSLHAVGSHGMGGV